VFVPSLLPVWIATGTGDPLRMTTTRVPPLELCPRAWLCAYEIAEFGTSTALSSCSVTIVTVAVMLGSSRTSVGSTPTSTLYVTTFEVVVPAGSTVATLPVKLRLGYAVSVNVAF
jgi:hypothetical protein